MNLAPRELPGDDYRWGVEIMLALDCLGNTLLRGWHHETLSSRSWRAWVQKLVFGRLFRPVIDAMFAWQGWSQGHCQHHYNAEVARAELIVKARMV